MEPTYRADSHIETEPDMLSVAVSHSLNFSPTLAESGGSTTSKQTKDHFGKSRSTAQHWH